MVTPEPYGRGFLARFTVSGHDIQLFIHLLVSSVLAAVTVFVHAVGFHVLLRALIKSHALTRSGFWPINRYVMGLSCWLLLIHLAEIMVWGLSYFWLGCLPDALSACYFSGVTYTTLGYGDLVLPESWRVLAPVEALTGILMCGLSTGLFFAIVNRWIVNWIERENSLGPQRPAPSKE